MLVSSVPMPSPKSKPPPRDSYRGVPVDRALYRDLKVDFPLSIAFAMGFVICISLGKYIV